MSDTWLYPAQALTEVLEWATDVQTSRNGSEERTATRSVPRHWFRSEGPVTPEKSREATNLMNSNLKHDWGVPSWGEAQAVASVDSGSSVTVYLDTTVVDFRTGMRVLFWVSSEQYQQGVVSEVHPTYLVVTSSGLSAYGSCLVMPLRQASLDGSPARSFNGRDWLLSTQFRLKDTLAWDPTAPPTRFLGDDLYTNLEFLKNGDRAAGGWSDLTVEADEGLGGFSIARPWQRPKSGFAFNWVARNPAEVWALRTWLYRRQGQHRRFWAPSNEFDVYSLEIRSGGTVLRIRDEGLLANELGRRHLAVRTLAGNWLTYQVVSYAAVAGNPEQLDLTLAQPLSVSLDQVAWVSWLRLMRLTTDRVELKWLGGGVVEAALSAQDTWSPPDDIPADPYLLIDGLVGTQSSPYPSVYDAGAGSSVWSDTPVYDFDGVP